MAESFKKEKRDFVSYTGNFSEAPIQSASKNDYHQSGINNTSATNKIITQSDSKRESD